MPRRFVPFALLAVLLPLQALPTATAGPAADPPPTPNQPTAAAKTFTLVTGDVVRVTGTGADRQVQVVTDVAPVGDVIVTSSNNDLYAVPTAVSGLLATGKLDPNLFNLTQLDRFGYDDKSTPNLPLIATYPATPSGATARRSLTAKAPAGVASTHALSAARATALTMKRSQHAAFLTGFASRTASSYNALRTGVTKLWLDGKVKASNDEGNALIGAGPVWQAGFDGTGQTIAVLDTGVDSKHPDLAGKVVASKSFVPGQPDPLIDKFGHGTHVSSIALGTGAASQGKYAGTAKGAKLAIGKVLDDSGSGQWSWVIEGMAWAAAQAPTVNMSLGGGPSDGTDPISTALDDISAQTGSLFVTAAGNMGPSAGENYPFTVATPAAASRALAVGNGTHSFYLNSSSSAGPAIGTLGLKPEIVAPGTDIVAARSADGLFPGLPDAPQYTSLTGTSMASPRVAGSVAVLRQQHPDWTAQRLEDAITSTSCTTDCRHPTPGGHGIAANPQIYWRGAGGLDLQRASQQTLHGTGLLQFGIHSDPIPADPTVTKTITYINDGDSPVTLQLTSMLQQPDPNYGVDPKPYQATAGLIDVPATVTVPAHGNTAVPIKLDLTKAPDGSVYGEILATGPGVLVRSTLAWARTAELHRLTIEAIGPGGEHGGPKQVSFGVLTDLDTGNVKPVYFSNGHGYVADFAGAVTDRPLLPAHRYSLMTLQGEPAVGPYASYFGSWTAGGMPDFVLTSDRAFTIDARQRKPWQISTERPTVNAGPWLFQLDRRTEIGGKPNTITLSASLADAGFSIYSIPGAAPTVGTLQSKIVQHREAPAVTLQIGGQSIMARRTRGPAFPAASTASLYDGGDAGPDRLAGAAGRLVLVDERPKTYPTAVVDDIVAAVTQAKATGVIVAVRDAGPAARSLTRNPTIPVAVVTQAQAASIRAALAAGRTRTFVRGNYPSPYSYDVVPTKTGGIGADTTVTVRDRDLGVRRTAYHAQGAAGYEVTGGIRGGAFNQSWLYKDSVPNGLERDDLVSPGYDFDRWWIGLNPDDRTNWADIHRLGRGQVVRADVGTGAQVPVLSGYVDSGSNGEPVLWTAGQLYAGSRSDVHMAFANGRATTAFKVNGTSCQGLVPAPCHLPTAGPYQVEYRGTQNQSPLATEIRGTWTVNVTKPAPDLKLVPQPIIDWNWSTAIGLTNTTPRHPYTLTVRPGYRPARPLAGPLPYPDDHGAFKVQLQVTYDDGATWVPAGTRTIDPGESGTFVVRPPQTSNGFVGYRITGNDEAGNALDQWVLRAAHTG
jgi:subtilisin family serine protease